LNCDNSDCSTAEDTDTSDDEEDWTTDKATSQALSSASSSDDSFSDDEPLANLVPKPTVATKAPAQKTYRWSKQTFTAPDVTFTGSHFSPPDSMEPEIPLQYFSHLVTNEMIDEMVANTNLYSTQQLGKSINTNRKEMEQVIGMFFRMGLVQMPGNRVYWEGDTAYKPVAEVMSRNRFQSLLCFTEERNCFRSFHIH